MSDIYRLASSHPQFRWWIQQGLGRGRYLFTRSHKIGGESFIKDILQDYAVPYAPLIGEEFILMHDNACPHVARIVREYLEEVGIPVLGWPAVSPDINPIEHIWDYLHRKVRARDIAPADLQVENVLCEEWDNLDTADVQKLIQYMPNRMRALIKLR